MIITITLNPAIDRRMRLDHVVHLNHLNRTLGSVREPGGKGITVARAINALGGDSVAIGFCGGQNGRIIKDMMTSMNIMHDFVDVAGQSRVNVQVIDPSGQHTEFNEPGPEISDHDFLRLIDKMEGYLDEKNIFVVSGSLPPNFPMAHYRKLLRTVKKAGCRLVVDAAGEILREALAFEPDYVKPSLFELAEFVGEQPTTDPETAVARARQMLDAGAQAVCVSMAHEGSVFVSKHHHEALYVNSEPKIEDCGSIGTGDAVVGAIANSLAKGFDIYELAKYTVAMGRACARLPGTEMASLKKVYQVYETIKIYTV